MYVDIYTNVPTPFFLPVQDVSTHSHFFYVDSLNNTSRGGIDYKGVHAPRHAVCSGVPSGLTLLSRLPLSAVQGGHEDEDHGHLGERREDHHLDELGHDRRVRERRARCPGTGYRAARSPGRLGVAQHPGGMHLHMYVGSMRCASFLFRFFCTWQDFLSPAEIFSLRQFLADAPYLD